MKNLFTVVCCLLIQFKVSAQLQVECIPPLQLTPEQTTVYKTDYLPSGFENMRVVWPEGIRLLQETPFSYTIGGKMARPIDNMRIIAADGSNIDIPMRNVRKVNTAVSFSFQIEKPAKKVSIKGSFNNWVVNDTLLKPVGKLPTTDWRLELNSIPEGVYQYKLVIDGLEANPIYEELVDNGMGGSNATFRAGEPETTLPMASTRAFTSTSITIQCANAIYYLAYWNNELIAKGNLPLSGVITIPLNNEIVQSEGRSHVRVFVCNRKKVGNDILIPMQDGKVITQTSQLTRSDFHNQIMYFMMVDRFANGDPKNDPKPLAEVLPKAQYLGGDLQGIQQQLNQGYFAKLGTNTLWLSPISENPKGAWGYWNKGVTTKFSAYHGYWPTSYSKVDTRFGTNKLFADLIGNAHAHQTNVVLDFVAHHIHVDHPLYKQHPDWVTPLHLPDGSLNTERWDDHRLTTWFDTFLPTLNFEQEAVRNLVADSVMYWVNNFELDGFRHDASKHVPESFWRLLTQKIHISQQTTNRPFYQIGETYGTPELISSYVNYGQMNGQFDFNFYDASVAALASDAATNKEADKRWNFLQNTMLESFEYYGWHHLMGNISGNQDRPRFASLADGSVSGSEDTKLAGWTRDIQNTGTKGYNRMAQLMALNMTLPGVPVIYYGDEYAMPGGNDPDNRRMMQFTGYNTNQQQLINTVTQLTNLRKNNMALLYGELSIIPVSEGCFAYQRSYFNQKMIVVFAKNKSRVRVPIPENTTVKTLFNHKTSTLENEVELDLNADDFEIILIN
jgi:glycosidase